MTAPELADLVARWGYAVLVPLSVVEGPVVSMVAGGLAGLKLISLPLVWALAVLGDVLGDCLAYAAGRWLRPDRLPGAARWLRRTRRQRLRLVRGMRRNAAALLVFGKVAHAPGLPILIAAGAARVPFWRFLLVNTLATLPKSALFVGLGLVFGATLATAPEWLAWGLAGLAAALGLVTALWISHRAREVRPCPDLS